MSAELPDWARGEITERKKARMRAKGAWMLVRRKKNDPIWKDPTLLGRVRHVLDSGRNWVEYGFRSVLRKN